MSFANHASNSRDEAYAWMPERASKLALVAMGVASLAFGVMAAAAEPAERESGDVAAEEIEASETEARQDADAEDLASVTARLVDDEVVVVGEEPEQNCRRMRVTGTRLPRLVCTPVAPSSADALHREEQARDMLRRQQEQSTLTPPDEGPYIQSGLPTGF